MQIFLFILGMILRALPLVIPAFIAGAKMGQSGENGLASSAAGIPDGWANVIIWGCVVVFVIGQASGWTLKGFFSWIRGISAWIVQSWKESEPKPEPVVPTPAPVARTTWGVVSGTPIAPAPIATPTPTPPAPLTP